MENLPTDYDENGIVFRTIKENKVDNENWYALDISIAACGIDDGNGEMYFCDEKSAKIIES